MVYLNNYHNYGYYTSFFYLKTRRFGDWILLRFQVEPTQMDPIERANLGVWSGNKLALSIGSI
jgi:hypothetical protein